MMGKARLGAIAVDRADPVALSEFYTAVSDLEVGFSSADLVVLTGRLETTLPTADQISVTVDTVAVEL